MGVIVRRRRSRRRGGAGQRRRTDACRPGHRPPGTLGPRPDPRTLGPRPDPRSPGPRPDPGCPAARTDLVCRADFWCNRHCKTNPVDLDGFLGANFGRKSIVTDRPRDPGPAAGHKIIKKMRTGHDMALELVCRAEFWCNRHCRTSLPRSREVLGPSLAENRPKTNKNTIFEPPYRPLSALNKGLMCFCSTALTVTFFDGERPRPKPRSI